MFNLEHAVEDAIESGQYDNYLNGESDNSWREAAVRDVVKSGLAGDTLDNAGVRLCKFDSPADIRKALNKDDSKLARQIFDENRLVMYPYNSGLMRYKLLKPIEDMKYLQPKGSLAEPYILPEVDVVMTKQHKELWITEGEKKTLCLIQNGEYCIGVSGVWNFKGGSEDYLWSDFSAFIMKSRVVYMAFDADLHQKPQVRSALYELGFKLLAKGATVKIVTWDALLGKGIDDYLLMFPDKKGALEGLKKSARSLTDFILPEHRNEVVRGIAHTKFGEDLDEVLAVTAKKLGSSPKYLKKEVKELKEANLNKKLGSEKEDMELGLMRMCNHDGLINLPAGYVVNLNSFDNAINMPIQSTLSQASIVEGEVIYTELCQPFIVASYISTPEGTKQVLKAVRGKEVIVDVALSDPKTFDHEVVSPLLGITLPRLKIHMLIDYVHEYQLANKGYILRLLGMERTGWHGNTFCIPTRNQRDIRWLDKRLETSLTLSEDEKGTMEKTPGMIDYYMQTPSGIVLLAALSAPLLRRFKVPNFILHVSGLFLSGKSCGQALAMSIYGNPSELRYSWNSTGVSKEIIASSYYDLPVWVEEFEESRKSVQEFKEFCYQYVSGQGRARGQKNIKLREPKRYAGVLLSSAEKDMDTVISSLGDDETKKLGLYRRVIEIQADKERFLFPFDNRKSHTDEEINEVINKLYEFSGSNYGWVGRKWIEYIESNWNELETLYHEKSGLVSDSGGLNSAFAVMLTVLHSPFMKGMLSEGSVLAAEQNLLSVVKRQGAVNKEARDIVTEFIEKTLNHLLENSNKVIGLWKEEMKHGHIAEIIWDRGKEMNDIFLLSNTFDRICKQYGFSREILLKQLAKAGKLKKQEESRYVSQRRLIGVKARGYYLVGVISPFGFNSDDDRNGSEIISENFQHCLN